MLCRTKFPGLIIVFFLITGCIHSPEAKLVKLYEGQVDPLMGKCPEEVIPLVTDQWKFELLSKWEKLNPTPEMVLKSTHRSAPFSKKEAQMIFEENGHYDVMIYVKKGREKSIGLTGNASYRLITPSNRHEIKYTDYVVVRMVFQDKKLHNYRFFHLKTGN
jgi:hypothetical protein